MCSPTAGGGRRVQRPLAVERQRQRGEPEVGDRWVVEVLRSCRALPSAARSRRRRRPRPGRRGRRPPSVVPASAPCRSSRVPRSRIAQSSSRWRTRSGLVAKRGSSTSSGRSRTAQIAAKRRSLPPAIISSPSRVANTWYGRHHREARALAVRHGAVREVAGEVVADVAERGLVERDVDDRALAGRPRSSSAASTPSAAHVPVPWSISDEPTRTPGRPGSPVIEISPPAACISAS